VLVPRSRGARLLAGYVAVYGASVVAFYVFSRYRLHVLPALAVLGAAGAAWLAGQVAERRWPRVGAAIAVMAAVGLFSAYGARAIVGVVPDGELNSAVNLAGLHMERGAFGEAAALLRDALDRFPGRAAVLCRAGELGLRTGEWAGARDAYAECLRADPRYPDAWYHLGLALERLGEPARAAAAYRSQVEAVPGHTLAAARLAALAAAR